MGRVRRGAATCAYGNGATPLSIFAMTKLRMFHTHLNPDRKKGDPLFVEVEGLSCEKCPPSKGGPRGPKRSSPRDTDSRQDRND
jgi:hypothetical protein